MNNLDWNKETLKYGRLHSRLQILGDMITSRLPCGAILDLGCGPGTLRSLLPGNRFEYYGCDIGLPDSLASDSTHYRRMDLNAPIEGNLFPGIKFDGIVCSGVLEYLRDESSLLWIIQSAIAHNGLLFVSQVNPHHWQMLIRPFLPQKHWSAWINLKSFEEHVRTFQDIGFEPSEAALMRKSPLPGSDSVSVRRVPLGDDQSGVRISWRVSQWVVCLRRSSETGEE